MGVFAPGTAVSLQHPPRALSASQRHREAQTFTENRLQGRGLQAEQQEPALPKATTHPKPVTATKTKSARSP